MRVRNVTVDARDNSDTITLSLEALAVFRGIYKRVAVQLDVDPSYVSRVARGERNAPFVTEALRKELHRVLGKTGLHNGDGNNHDHSNGSMAASRDGHGSGLNHRDSKHPRNAQARDGHSPSGHHAPNRNEKTKTKSKKSLASKRKS